MDYGTRLILAIIVGAGAGYAVSYFFNIDMFLAVGTGLVFSIATDTTLRTMKNVKAPENPVLEAQKEHDFGDNSIHQSKPPEPNF